MRFKYFDAILYLGFKATKPGPPRFINGWRRRIFSTSLIKKSFHSRPDLLFSPAKAAKAENLFKFPSRARGRDGGGAI